MGTAAAPLRQPSSGAPLPTRILELAPTDRARASSIFVALQPCPNGLSIEGIRANLRSGIDDAPTFEQFLDSLVATGIFQCDHGIYRIASDNLLAA